jgi:hypothetical protein
MRKYWLKIGFGAFLIFAVGFIFISGVRGVKHKIMSDQDLEIPLGAFIDFNLDGTKLGSIRSLTIKRSAPKMLVGFDLRVRLSDSSGYAAIENCHVSVNDTRNIDERTHFICLKSDSGYVPFGEVRAELRSSDDSRTYVTPLLLPPSAVADIQRGGGDPAGPSLGDSIRAEVASRIRVQSRVYRDSIRAAELDRTAERAKQKADSIRRSSAARTPDAPVPAKPPSR